MTPLHGAETAEVAKAMMDAKADIHAQTKVSAYAIGEECVYVSECEWLWMVRGS